MRPRVRLADPTSPDDVMHLRQLMAEYAALPHVVGRWPTVAADLAALPAPFVAPSGALALAWADDVAVGIGGVVRATDPGVAEVKRLYVRPTARGQGLGDALLARLIDEAAAFGCHTVRLDTAPELTAARALYARFGFVEIPPYRTGLAADALCFERRVTVRS